MKKLTREQCSQIAGGDPGMVLAGGGGFGNGGSSFGSGGIDFGSSSSMGIGFDSNAVSGFGSSVGSGLESVWEGSGGFESGAAAGAWSLEAIGIEGGPMAVVRITAADPPGIPIFDNTQPVASYGPGEASWEGQYLGTWVNPAPMSYEHTAFDGALIANTGRLVGAATTVFVDGALTGAAVGSAFPGVGNLAGIVVGGLAAWGTYYLLQNDHPTGHLESAPPKLGSMVP